MEPTESEMYTPASRREWRQWLHKNHRSRQSVWLVYYKKGVGQPTVTYNEAVDEALCYGWIDSTRKSLGSEQFIQFFCKRKPNSVWSKINKEKVRRLTEEGLMTPAGLESIDIAKENGSWTVLDEVEELVIPPDLEQALSSRPGASAYFLSLSRSVKKMLLYWLVSAKRPETRYKRIEEIATLAAQQKKPRQFT